MLGSLFSILAGAGYFVGKTLGDTAKRDAGEAYINAQGYNRERQQYLWHLSFSLDEDEQLRFCRLAGRHVSSTGRDLPNGTHVSVEEDRMLALRQIALKEGWKYYEFGDLLADPVYTKLTGMKCNPNINSCAPDWDAIAQELNEETERKEVWRDRCEHGREVDVFPMDYGSEYWYRVDVDIRYHSWRGKYRNTDLSTDLFHLKGINCDYLVDKYETEEEFLEAIKKKEEYYSQFQVYRELKNRAFFSITLNTVERSWDECKENFSEELSISDIQNFLYDVMIGVPVGAEEMGDARLRIAKDKLALLGYLTPENEKELEPYFDVSNYTLGITRVEAENKARAAASKERAQKLQEEFDRSMSEFKARLAANIEKNKKAMEAKNKARTAALEEEVRKSIERLDALYADGEKGEKAKEASSQSIHALPSPKSQEPSSITQSTKEQTPPNTKTNSNVHITATGKTYTMRRGNKKSKLTLTKRV